MSYKHIKKLEELKTQYEKDFENNTLQDIQNKIKTQIYDITRDTNFTKTQVKNILKKIYLERKEQEEKNEAEKIKSLVSGTYPKCKVQSHVDMDKNHCYIIYLENKPKEK